MAGSPDPDLREFADIWGEFMHSARWYRWLCIGLGVICLIQGFVLVSVSLRPDPLPLVVRVADVGRAQAVDFTPAQAVADQNDPVVPYFLNQFVRDHYERRVALGLDPWQRSLLFLSEGLADEAARRDGPEFVEMLNYSQAAAGGGDAAGYTEVRVENFALRVIPQAEPPYSAEAFFDLVYSYQGEVTDRQALILSLRFTFADTLPREVVLVNPLGIHIVYLQLSGDTEVEAAPG